MGLPKTVSFSTRRSPNLIKSKTPRHRIRNKKQLSKIMKKNQMRTKMKKMRVNPNKSIKAYDME